MCASSSVPVKKCVEEEPQDVQAHSAWAQYERQLHDLSRPPLYSSPASSDIQMTTAQLLGPPLASLREKLAKTSILDLHHQDLRQNQEILQILYRSSLESLRTLDVHGSQGVNELLILLAENPTLRCLETVDASGTDLNFESLQAFKVMRTKFFIRSREVMHRTLGGQYRRVALLRVRVAECVILSQMARLRAIQTTRQENSEIIYRETGYKGKAHLKFIIEE